MALRESHLAMAPLSLALCVAVPGYGGEVPVVFAARNSKTTVMAHESKRKANTFYEEVVAHFSTTAVLTGVSKYLAKFRAFKSNGDSSATLPVHAVPAVVSTAFPSQPSEVHSPEAFSQPESPAPLSYHFTLAPHK